MPLLHYLLRVLTLTLTLTLLPTTHSTTTCTTTNHPITTTTPYTKCTTLPTLKSTLHYTYTPSNSTLSVAFTATPPSPSGWISWGINPTGTGMAGTQSFIAFKSPSSGSIYVATYNLSSYSVVTPAKLSFRVYLKRAVFDSDDGSFTIFAVVKCDGGKVNFVWQVGPGVTEGFPDIHQFNSENLKSRSTIHVSSVGGGDDDSSSEGSSSSGADFGLKKRNIHGILNAISWGLLFPFGAIISRYLRTFESADPAWFYIHATCQTSAYAIGVAGWITGLQLGRASKGIVYEGHRCIGIILFCIATLQIVALFLRPKIDHKYRFYWNIYHHCIGYTIIILGIINVFKGLDILQPEKKWRSTYVTILLVLGGIAVLLEALTWVVVLRWKSSRSTKPYA